MFSAELQWDVSHLSLSTQHCSYSSHNDDGLDTRTKQQQWYLTPSVFHFHRRLHNVDRRFFFLGCCVVYVLLPGFKTEYRCVIALKGPLVCSSKNIFSLLNTLIKCCNFRLTHNSQIPLDSSNDGLCFRPLIMCIFIQQSE